MSNMATVRIDGLVLGVQSNGEIKARYESALLSLPHCASIDLRKSLQTEIDKHTELIKNGKDRICEISNNLAHSKIAN